MYLANVNVAALPTGTAVGSLASVTECETSDVPEPRRESLSGFSVSSAGPYDRVTWLSSDEEGSLRALTDSVSSAQHAASTAAALVRIASEGSVADGGDDDRFVPNWYLPSAVNCQEDRYSESDCERVTKCEWCGKKPPAAACGVCGRQACATCCRGTCSALRGLPSPITIKAYALTQHETKKAIGPCGHGVSRLGTSERRRAMQQRLSARLSAFDQRFRSRRNPVQPVAHSMSIHCEGGTHETDDNASPSARGQRTSSDTSAQSHAAGAVGRQSSMHPNRRNSVGIKHSPSISPHSHRGGSKQGGGGQHYHKRGGDADELTRTQAYTLKLVGQRNNRTTNPNSPLALSVVHCTSQRMDHPAASVLRAGTRWEPEPFHVNNQSIVFEIVGGPANVSTISFGVPGSDATPRRCKVQYSKISASGPWKEAWTFSVESKDAAVVKDSFDWDEGMVSSFKEALHQVCPGGIEEAWKTILDRNGDGRLSYVEFKSACHRMRTALRDKFPHMDHQRVFEALDMDDSGSVELEDLMQDRRRLAATWWRLTVVDNWGSTKRLQILGPLQLFAREDVHDEEDLTMRGGTNGTPACLVTAFDIGTLGVDPRTINLRNIAKKLDVPLHVLEEMHETFIKFDIDGNGTIGPHEFENIIMTLHGTEQASDLPVGCIQAYWRQADPNQDGEVDFEEFVGWFGRYFANNEDLEASWQAFMDNKPVEDSDAPGIRRFYSSMGKKRLQQIKNNVRGSFLTVASRHAFTKHQHGKIE